MYCTDMLFVIGIFIYLREDGLVNKGEKGVVTEMKDLVLVPTTYKVEWGEYVYKISLVARGWIVTRNPIEYPTLATCNCVWVGGSWVAVLNRECGCFHYYDSLEDIDWKILLGEG